MGNEGLWHLLEHIFGYLDHDTIVICRKVSYFWDESLEPLERSFLINILRNFVVKITAYHRSVKKDSEEGVLNVISGWNEAVQNYRQNATIEELRELKESVKKLLPPNGKCLAHPVQSSVRIGDVKILEFLFCASYDVNEKFNRGGTAFLWACTYGNVKIAKWIFNFTKENNLKSCLNDTDNAGMTAFHWACYHHETAKWILGLEEIDEIDLNARDERGRTPLLVACEGGATETAKMFLDFSKTHGGIDLNVKDNERRTAFHMACKNQNADIPKVILDFSKESEAIDLNARANRGLTAFQLVCQGNGKPQFAKWILDFAKETNAIDLNARDSNGMTALHLACRVDFGKHTTENVRLILDYSKKYGGIDINAKDACGYTPFHWACNQPRNGSIECANLFLCFSIEKVNISLNATDNHGQTPFHTACQNYNAEITKSILEFSKAYGRIDLNWRDENEETAFQIACQFFNVKIVKQIIENWKYYGIDITNKNMEGKTALDILQGLGMEGLNEQFDELIEMLSEEYLKIDASEPVIKDI